MEHDVTCERLEVAKQLMKGVFKNFTLDKEEFEAMAHYTFPFGIACNCQARGVGSEGISSKDQLALMSDAYYFVLDARIAAAERKGGRTWGAAEVVERMRDERARRREERMGQLIRIDFRNRRRVD